MSEGAEAGRRAWLLKALADAPPEVQRRVWKELSPGDHRAFAYAWELLGEQGQQEPAGDWAVWLMMAGRGFGKTRTGAEWVLSLIHIRCRRRSATMDRICCQTIPSP